MTDYSLPRGTRDVLFPETSMIRILEKRFREVFRCYGYREIITPMFEKTELFARSLGQTTDIVEKEMYTFSDRKGRSLTLRPEGTAPVIRAYIENGLYNDARNSRLFYSGSMFRYEKPQAGRFREFMQIGAENIGNDSPLADAEILCLANDIMLAAGLSSFNIRINSVGCPDCRSAYVKELKKKVLLIRDSLCPDCKRRIDRNPMRILDCKKDSPRIKDLAGIQEHICSGCLSHFSSLKEILRCQDIKFEVDPLLVRGLDYYTRTAFEINSPLLGAQDAVCAGGRYDMLIKELGGPDLPATGFALGMERVLNLLRIEKKELETDSGLCCYVVHMGESAKKEAFSVLRKLRKRGISCIMEPGEKSLKSQMRLADKYGAAYAVIIGDDEINKKEVVVKDMATGKQERIDMNGLPDFMGKSIRKSE